MITITTNHGGKVSGYTDDSLMFDAVIRDGELVSLFVADSGTGELAYYLDGKSEGAIDEVLGGRNVAAIASNVVDWAK